MSMIPYEEKTVYSFVPQSMKPWFNEDQVILQLDSGYSWSSDIISYSFPTTAWFIGNEADGFSSSPLTQQAVVNTWMELWDDLIENQIINVGTDSSADIRIANSTTGPGYAYAYYPNNYSGSAVWFNPGYNAETDSWNDLISPTPGVWGWTAIGHEIGHALGLSHPGAYNGGSPTYDLDAEYTQDSQQYTIMSYFMATETGADISDSTGYWVVPQTPMMDDILAIQAIYGADTTTRTNSTTYGFNSNADNDVFDFSINQHPWICIYDAGGIDTLDLSGWATSSYISLVPGSFSDSDGMTANISIARNTIIENAIGGNGNDSLIGNNAANTLDGGLGSDAMTGGDGSDIYYVRDAGDVVTEVNATASTGGTDTVYSYLNNYTLTANVEKGRIMSAGAANLTGNALDNTLYAGVGNNILNGGAGIDTLSYQFGVSGTTGVTVNLALTTAQVTGGSGSDTLQSIENLTGSKYNDTLIGNNAANTLDGGLGSDAMTGGDGADVYYVRDAGDVVTEVNATASTGETDTVYSYLNSYTLTANVEKGRIMNTGAANLTGNALDNTLFAGVGNNVLDGGAGIDTLSYQFGVPGTTGVTVNLALTTAQVTGGSGSDTLLGIENLVGSKYNDTLIGDNAANKLTGGLGNDSIDGGLGNDILDGGLGSDAMTGGDGSDAYYVRDAGDVVTEVNATASTGGTDTVYSYLNYTLTANVEKGRIMSAGAANLTGNALDNTLYAGVGNNILDGGAGIDTLSYLFGVPGTTGVTVNLTLTTAQGTGGSGSDTLLGIENLTGSSYADSLIGNGGANTLTGGLGKDTLTGGAGNDIFDFNALDETGLTSSVWDIITDFVRGQDKIDLSTIDANTATTANNAFTSMIASAAAFTTAGQLRVTGGVLYGNVDSDVDAELAIALTGISELDTTDFIL